MTLRPSKTGTEHAHPSFDAGFVHSARRFVIRRSGFGQMYMKEYLQYVADNYFKPYGRTLGYLKHYGLRSDDTLRQLPAGQHRMFSVLDGVFLRWKEAYFDPEILRGHRLLESQSLGIDSHSFRTFVEQYGLHLSHPNRNILRLLEIREGGYFCRLCRPEGISCLAAFRFFRDRLRLAPTDSARGVSVRQHQPLSA